MASGKARICYAIRRNEFRCRKEITNLSKEEEYSGFMRFLWPCSRPICAFRRSLLHEDDWTVGRTSSAHPPYFKDGGYLLSSLDSIDRGEIIICFGRQLEQRITFLSRFQSTQLARASWKLVIYSLIESLFVCHELISFLYAIYFIIVKFSFEILPFRIVIHLLRIKRFNRHIDRLDEIEKYRKPMKRFI